MGIGQENRIDQRMPLEFVTNSFLLPNQAQGVTERPTPGRKLCCSCRKPDGNGWDKAGVVDLA